MIKVFIDGKLKAEIPVDNVKHKDFLTVLQMYLNNYDWKKLVLARVEQ